MAVTSWRFAQSSPREVINAELNRVPEGSGFFDRVQRSARTAHRGRTCPAEPLSQIAATSSGL